MQIKPIVQHVELAARHLGAGIVRPEGALIVTGLSYDQSYDGQSSRDLHDVRPAAIAISNYVLDDPNSWGPQGLFVGTLAINQFVVDPGSSSLTLEAAVMGGVTYYRQFAAGVDVEVELSPSSTIFKGGAVSWGDGVSTNFTLSQTQPLTHTYANAGTYDVTLRLSFADSVSNLAWSNSPSAVRRVTVS